MNQYTYLIAAMLTEKTDQVADFQRLIKIGTINGIESAKQWLQERGQIIDNGHYSNVYASIGPWVIKLTADASSDPYYDFAATVIDQQLWMTNPMLPVIRFARLFGDGSGVAVVERLNQNAPPEANMWDRPAFMELIRRAFYNTSFGFRTASGPKMYTPEEIRADLQKRGVDMSAMDQIFAIIRECGEYDIRRDNVGFRSNGQAVIFDPVKNPAHYGS